MKNVKHGTTLNGTLFEALREEILTGKLLPGQRLKISQLAAMNAVSLNVVREALSRLAGEQLVEIEPQYGFAVRGLSADDLVDLVRQRAIFEGIALRQSIARGDVEWQSNVLAAHHRMSHTPMVRVEEPTKLNPDWLARHEEFNLVMMQACGSPRLLQIIRQLAEAAAMYHRALLPAVSDNRKLESEHSALLDAILAGDPDTAVQVLTSHLEQTRDLMLPLLKTAVEAVDASTPTAKSRRGRPPTAWTATTKKTAGKRRATTA